METLNNRKRKKRKTRRCLDELRKKTHQTIDICKINTNINAKQHKNKANCKNNNYITNNRLTLFNKAVRSETVTRIQLGELEGKRLKFNKDRETITSYNSIPFLEHNNNKAKLEKRNKSITEDKGDVENLSLSKHNCEASYDIETPKSVILFSSGSQHGKVINTKLDSPVKISLISSSSPSPTKTNFETNICDEIMDSIERYVEEKCPQIIKNMDNDIKKAKEELFKLCYENKYKSQISDNVYNHHSSPDTQIQNPRSYIEFSRSQHSESKTSGIHETSTGESNSPVSIHIPSPSPIVSAVYDTPEYSYYPHRLN